MGLTGLGFLLLLCVLAAALVAGTAWAWERWPPRLAWPARLAALALIMAFGAVLAADQENRTYGFYDSFGELLGGHPAVTGSATLPGGGLSEAATDRGERDAADGRGVVLPVALPGARSHLDRDGYVYLPAAYFRRADLRFPVVELFHGTPGSPKGWVGPMHVATVLDEEIAAGRVPPLIAVMPMYDDGSRDRECVNAVRGERDETYLDTDVPADVARDFRVLPGADSWAAMGYSTGGYCAVDVALHDPGRYAAAVSLSGYFEAVADRSGALFGHRIQVREADSPTWWARHHAGRLPALYLVASRGDPGTVPEVERMVAALGPDRRPTVVVLRSGGHNFRVWSAVSAPAFDWVAAHLPGPLAPPLRAGAPPARRVPARELAGTDRRAAPPRRRSPA